MSNEKIASQGKGGTFDFGFRGWLVIIYAILTTYVGLTITNSVMNLTTLTLNEMHGWSVADMISCQSVGEWIGIPLLIVVGQIMARKSPRIMALIVGAIYTVAVFMMPFVSSFIEFAVVFNITVCTNCIWMMFVNVSIIANWFPRKKGMAMAIVGVGMALGSGTGTLVYTWLEGIVGFVGTFVVIGAACIVCLLMLFFVVKDYPEQCGAFPDNDRNMTHEEAMAILNEGLEERKNSVWSIKKLLTTKETYVVAACCGMIPLFVSGSMSTLIPRLISYGYEQTFAVMLMTIVSFFAIAASLVNGGLVTKFGVRKSYIFVACCAIAACICNQFAALPFVVASIVFTGILLGAGSIFIISFISDLWGRFNFQNAQSVIQPLCSCVSSFGAILIAQIGANYTYGMAYIVVAVILVVGVILMFSLKVDRVHEITEELEAQRKAKKLESEQG